MLDLEHIQSLSEQAEKIIWQDEDDFGNVSIKILGTDNVTFITTLLNAWPEIYKELVASRKLVEKLKGMNQVEVQLLLQDFDGSWYDHPNFQV